MNMSKRPVEKIDFRPYGAAIKKARTGRKESRNKAGNEMFLSPRYLANIASIGSVYTQPSFCPGQLRRKNVFWGISPDPYHTEREVTLIANRTRNNPAFLWLTEDEKAAGIAENIVAIDGIAVVVDTANEVAGLTSDQLASIYKGEVTNWSEVGGADQPIVVVGREAGSGTRSAFEELLAIEDQCAYANELDSTGAVMAKVASTPGAIGYVSLDVLDDTVKTVAVDDVEPTVENIKGGTYALSRPFVMATNGEISEQSEAVQAIFTYLASDEGKALVESVGLITVD